MLEDEIVHLQYLGLFDTHAENQFLIATRTWINSFFYQTLLC